MKKNNKVTFGTWEAVSLILITLTSQIVLGFPRAMTETAGTAGWFVPVYDTGIVLIIYTVIVKLYKGFEGKDLLDIGEYIGGDAGRIVVGLLLTAYFTFIISIVLREFAEDMKIIALTVSPISFVTMFFVAGMIMAAYTGIESITRFSALVAPIIVAGFLFLVIGVSPYYNIDNILPILGTGPADIFGKGFLKISIYSGLLVIFLMTPFFKTHKIMKTVGFTSISLGGILFFLGAFCYQLVYPYPIAKESFLPIYQMARLINFGRFFQRVESVFVMIWAASALIYLSFVFLLIVYVFKKTFKLEYHRPMILPFIVIVYTVSLLPPNLMDAVNLEQIYFRNNAWIIAFILPILLLLIAKYKKKGKKKEAGRR